MFKNILHVKTFCLKGLTRKPVSGYPRRRPTAAILCLALAASLTGCSTTRRFQPFDLSEPGWKSREGQAVWRVRGAEIAGELLLATHRDGRTLVHFSKPPFPVLVGQSDPNGWQAEFPAENKIYSGPGRPPKRLLWLWLAPGLVKASLPAPLEYRTDGNEFSLTNRRSGETIEGFLQEKAQ